MGFHGDLEDLPLQDILYVLNSRAKSGRLTLSTSSKEISLSLDKGRVAAVTSNDDNLRIGRLLVDQGYLKEHQLEQALALQQVVGTSVRVGDLLIDLGFVTPKQIGQAVAAQFEASLFRVLLEPSGTFTFTPEESIRIDPLMDEIPIELMILNAVRMADEWTAANSKNVRVGLQDIRVSPELLDSLDEQECRVLIGILNGAHTSYDLAKETGLPAPDLKLALKSLTENHLIVQDEMLEPEEAVREERLPARLAS